MAVASSDAGRSEEALTLVVVSKTRTVAEILDIYEMGHRDFGENRAQELAKKAPLLPDDIRWHFVGSLQSNKARQVRPITHLLHSMDRRSLATSWLKGVGVPPPVLLQVNVGEEEQKSGINPSDVEGVLEWMLGMGLTVRGLMAIPPIPKIPEESRPYFRTLRKIMESLPILNDGRHDLSMGMTDDFEVAISEGASIIRVGRAIFGPRK